MKTNERVQVTDSVYNEGEFQGSYLKPLESLANFVNFYP